MTTRHLVPIVITALVGSAVAGASPRPFRPAPFGLATVSPAFEVDGTGKNIDSVAFWEAPDPADSLMFVTAKRNRLVEVWRYPFEGHEQAAITMPGPGKVNGVAVDQQTDRLYVAQARKSSTIYVFSLPDRRLRRTFGADTALGSLGPEPNLDLLSRPHGGSPWLFVTADRLAHVLDARTGASVRQFRPDGPRTFEAILADAYHQVIYIPDENGRQGVYVFNTDGTNHERCDASGDCAHRFGQGVFDADAEGIVLYRTSRDTAHDNGDGLIVVADQRRDHTEFEFFDRRTWRHLGALIISGVSNTDGIASTQTRLPGYPLGLFAAVNDDESTVGVGWDTILAATGLEDAVTTDVTR